MNHLRFITKYVIVKSKKQIVVEVDFTNHKNNKYKVKFIENEVKSITPAVFIIHQKRSHSLMMKRKVDELKELQKNKNN